MVLKTPQAIHLPLGANYKTLNLMRTKATFLDGVSHSLHYVGKSDLTIGEITS